MAQGPLSSNGHSSLHHHSYSATTATRRENNGSMPTSTSSRGAPVVRFQDNEDSNNDDSYDFMDTLMGIVTGCIACWLIVGLMTILVFLSFTVRPFSRSTYRRLAASWGANLFLDAVSLLLPNCKVCLTGDSDVPSPVGSSVVLANHVTEADWWALFLLGRCVGLKGSLKVFLRNEYLRLNLKEMHSAAAAATNGTNGSTNNSNGINGHYSHSTPTIATSNVSNATSTSTPTAPPNTVPDLALMAKLLHLFLDFPIINEDFASDREQLFSLLRSFGPTDNVHLLFYPEGWSIHHGADRTHVHQKSNQFAQREGKPALQHLLLPRARGFHASLECLRETAPVVYDVTMAYDGYNGSLPFKRELSLCTLWDILRRNYPKEVHLRIKRYSMEEVLQDSNWLFKTWAEKDRRLSHFARQQSFPMESRYARLRVFDTRNYTLETAIVSLFRLMVVPCTLPFLFLMSVPLFWTLLWIWWAQCAYRRIVEKDEDDEEMEPKPSRTPGGSAAAPDTPFLPTTPFVSPSPFAWRDMFNNNKQS